MFNTLNAWLNAETWIHIGADIAIKAALIVLLVYLLTSVVFRRNVLIRSSIWNACLVGLLLLPLATTALPSWRICCLPRPAMDAPTKTSEAIPNDNTDSQGIDLQPAMMDSDVSAGEVAPSPNPLPSPVIAGTESDTTDHAALSERATPWWPAAVMLTYLAGAMVLAIRLLGSALALRRLRKAAVLLDDPDWVTALQHWKECLGVQSPVAIGTNGEVTVPIVFGLRRPMILLPETLADSATAKQREAILLHELAHVRRNDYFWQIVLHVARVVYWPHPLLWPAWQTIGSTQEQACDALCVHHLAGPRDYAAALIDVARGLAHRPAAALGIAMARTSRIARRLSFVNRTRGIAQCLARRPIRLTILSMAIIAASCLAPVELARKSVAAADESESTNQSAAETTKLIAHLPNNVDVELMGITNHIEDTNPQWWYPDGSPLLKAPHLSISSHFPKDRLVKTIVFKVTGDTCPSLRFDCSETRAGIHIYPLIDDKYARGTIKPGALEMLLPEIDASLQTGISIGVHIGNPRTLATWNAKRTQHSTYSDGNGGIVFQPPYMKDGQIVVPVTHTDNDLYHEPFLVAVDSKGILHDSNQNIMARISGFTSAQYCFNTLTLEDIKEFQFKVRDFEWVTFENISLCPGIKTNFQIAKGTTMVGGRIAARHFVKLVIGKDRMTFQGEETTWEKLPELLAKVSDREYTVFEIAVASKNLTIAQYDEAFRRASKLREEYGFEYLSYVGEHPLGTKAGPPRNPPVETQPTSQEASLPPPDMLQADAAVQGLVQALRDSEWTKALDYCSAKVRNAAKTYPSAEAFVRDVVPIQQLVTQTKNPIYFNSHQSSKGGPWGMHALAFRIAELEPDPADRWSLPITRQVWWQGVVKKDDSRSVVDFPTTPFNSQVETGLSELKRIQKEAIANEMELEPKLKGVHTRLTPLAERFQIGKPMLFRLELVNEGPAKLVYEHSGAGVNDSMMVTTKRGSQVPYTAGDVQTMMGHEVIDPGTTVILLDKWDLANHYRLTEPGRYTVQFRGGIQIAEADPHKTILVDRGHRKIETLPDVGKRSLRLFPSNTVEIEVVATRESSSETAK